VSVPKFFFDECAIGPRAVRDIRSTLELSSHKIIVEHLFTYFKIGTPDDVWIPKIAEEEGWVIITADSGKKRGPKLPELCVEYEITHVLMSPSIAKLSTYGRIRAFHDNILDLIEASDAKKGTRFRLRRTSGGDGTAVERIDLRE
jgi:hypothetical protein